MTSRDSLDAKVRAFNESFLRCPVKGCYEKDRMRYISYEVLGDHIQFSHIDKTVLDELEATMNCWEHPDLAPYFLKDRISKLKGDIDES